MADGQGVDIAREAHDLTCKWLAGRFGAALLQALGIPVRAVVRPGPTALPNVSVRGYAADFVFLLEDAEATGGGEYLDVEFQTTPADLRRFLVYNALLLQRDGRPVRTAVVYTADVTVAPEVLEAGSVAFRVQNVYLARFDGDAVFERLETRMRAGAALNAVDAVHTALLPLMRLRFGAEEATRRAAWVAGAIADEDTRVGCVAAIVALSSRVLEPEVIRRLLREEPTVANVLEELVADALLRGLQEGRAKGRQEGETRGKAEALHAVVRAREWVLSDAARHRLEEQGDAAVIDGWLLLAVRARDAEEFETGISG